MKKDLNYDDRAHRFGRLSLGIGTAATLIFPLTLILVFRIEPNWKSILTGAGYILMFMLATSTGEFLSFSPMIGSSAMYIMVLTGNFTNLKIPSSIAAMEAVGLDPANYTDESDVISTIAMAVSAIVSIVIIILGVILIAPLSKPLSNPALAPAFTNIVPALFGALATSMMSKNFKLAIVPFVLGVALIATRLIPDAFILPVLILVGVLSARFMYKKQWVR